MSSSINLCYVFLCAVSMATMYQFDFDLFMQCDVLLALINIVSDLWCVVLNSIVDVQPSTRYSTPTWQREFIRQC